MKGSEICLPGAGWEIAWLERSDLTKELGWHRPFMVNRAIIQKGETRMMVYYWFDQRGRNLTGDYEAKVYALWDAAFRGRTDGSLVRVLTPILQNEGEATADARLEKFLASTVTILPGYIPEG